MTPWAWDATTATVRSNSATLVTNFLSYCGPLAYFFAEIAEGDVQSGTATYKVSSAGQPGSFDPTLYLPSGIRPGLSNDHHIAIVDTARGRWHDFWRPTLDSSGKVYKWSGGASMPLGAVQIAYAAGSNIGATAAGVPLLRGAVSIQEVAGGAIPHALAITAANLGPKPNPYPAGSWTGGYKTGNQPAGSDVSTHLPLGSWLRLAPSASLPSTASKLERLIFTALKQYGLIIRDRGSTVAFHGLDPHGGGASIPAWRNAGVPLGSDGVLRLGNIPWRSLQVLQPPPQS